MQADFNHFSTAVADVLDVEGDFIECGVYKGATFIPLARAAARMGNRTIYGIDSFVGMQPAHPVHDLSPDGQMQYGEGSFYAGGDLMVAQLAQETQEFGNKVVLIKEFIPQAFASVHEPALFAFAHVDLDQYIPTFDTLLWLWPRMNEGGIIALHDWFPDYQCLASLAIKNFCKDHGIAQPPRSPVSYAYLTKGKKC